MIIHEMRKEVDKNEGRGIRNDCAIGEVIVSLEGTGNLQTNIIVESVMDKDIICSEVTGLVGEPFSIETTS